MGWRRAGSPKSEGIGIINGGTARLGNSAWLAPGVGTEKMSRHGGRKDAAGVVEMGGTPRCDQLTAQFFARIR
ncbi:hypothetical protein FAGKG844_180067 [Frankia sp. AgKG'84/4]